jgi:hypothetical protein
VLELWTLGIVKRLSTVLTAGSAIVGGLLLIILPISYHFEHRRNAVAITSSLWIAVYDGTVWFDSQFPPSRGRISDIGHGKVPYEGGEAHAAKDWGWYIGAYGIGQRTFRGEQDEFVAKDRGLHLPGIYYRHFEREKEPLLWWVSVSLWYPILLSAVLPFLWICYRDSLWFRKS